MTHWTIYLRRQNACAEAIEWARQFDDPNEAWKACREAAWMRWVLNKLRLLPDEFSAPGDPSVVRCCGRCEANAILRTPAAIRRYWPEFPL